MGSESGHVISLRGLVMIRPGRARGRVASRRASGQPRSIHPSKSGRLHLLQFRTFCDVPSCGAQGLPLRLLLSGLRVVSRLAPVNVTTTHTRLGGYLLVLGYAQSLSVRNSRRTALPGEESVLLEYSAR